MNISGPFLISSTANITYFTGFSGFSKVEREAFLLLTKKNNYIITDGRYSEAVKKKVKGFILIEKTQGNTIKNLLADIIKKQQIKELGFEKDNLTFAEYEMLKSLPIKLQPMSLVNLRNTKSRLEIAAIEKACGLGDRAFDFILKRLKLGASEKDIAFQLEMFIKQHGADLSFPPIVAFGKSSSIPHHATGNTALKKGDFVLLDFGVKIDNYCSDMSRTLVFGKATDEQKKMHETVLTAQQKAIQFLHEKCHSERSEESRSFGHKPQDDILASEVDQVARDHIIAAGYPSIPHSLGHGIGIEVHEAPRLSPKSKDILKNGMVFSVEPGIYIEGFGGVRIEDLIVLEAGTPRLLTQSPKHLIEL